MSVIALATVKAYLRVSHTADDTLLQALLDGAEDEALRVMNRSELPGTTYDLPEDSSSETDVDTETAIAPSVVVAVALLVSADYEAAPEDREALRAAALAKLQPYRAELGC